jgi:adenine-specific DNA-methyltransferase
VDYEASHEYENAGEYQIMVKVIDVFGNDTNKVIKVRVG